MSWLSSNCWWTIYNHKNVKNNNIVKRNNHIHLITSVVPQQNRIYLFLYKLLKKKLVGNFISLLLLPVRFELFKKLHIYLCFMRCKYCYQQRFLSQYNMHYTFCELDLFLSCFVCQHFYIHMDVHTCQFLSLSFYFTIFFPVEWFVLRWNLTKSHCHIVIVSLL